MWILVSDSCEHIHTPYTYKLFFFLEFIFPLLHRIVRHGHIPLRYFFCSRCGDNPCWRKSDFLNHGAPSGWAQCCIFSPVSRALKRAAASSKVRIGARRRARKKLRAHVYMYVHTYKTLQRCSLGCPLTQTYVRGFPISRRQVLRCSRVLYIPGFNLLIWDRELRRRSVTFCAKNDPGTYC
jgi:hypothetical protein